MTFTSAGSPGLYSRDEGSTATFKIRFSGGTTISFVSLNNWPLAIVTASTKKFGMSFFVTSISASVLLPSRRTTCGGK